MNICVLNSVKELEKVMKVIRTLFGTRECVFYNNIIIIVEEQNIYRMPSL